MNLNRRIALRDERPVVSVGVLRAVLVCLVIEVSIVFAVWQLRGLVTAMRDADARYAQTSTSRP